MSIDLGNSPAAGTSPTPAEQAQIRSAIGLGTLATLSPSGTQDATTYLRGDNTWATVAGGTGFTGIANRLIIGGATTNADGYLENTLATTGTSVTVNNAILAVPAAVGTTNTNLVLSPKGTGALIAGPAPDGTAVGGNARGAGAVDLQITRSAATQVASGANSLVAGNGNTASSASTIVSGNNNIASGGSSLMVGSSNSTSNSNSLIGGSFNSGSGNNCLIIGEIAAANARSSFALGNNVTATNSGSLALGIGCESIRYGSLAFGSGRFSTVGDGQFSMSVMGQTSNDAITPVELRITGANSAEGGGIFTSASAQYFTISSGRIVSGIIHVHGVNANGSKSAYYIKQFSIKNAGGICAIIGTVTAIGADVVNGTTCVIEADDTNDRLAVKATGNLGETWRWNAVIHALDSRMQTPP